MVRVWLYVYAWLTLKIKKLLQNVLKNSRSILQIGSTKCIMSDKNMTERTALSEQFQQSKLLICLFHTLRTMKREVSCEKLGISHGERSIYAWLKIVYARDEEEYIIVSFLMSWRMAHSNLWSTLKIIGITFAMNRWTIWKIQLATSWIAPIIELKASIRN